MSDPNSRWSLPLVLTQSNNFQTYSGFSTDEVVSAAQKSIRRAWPEAYQWFLEMFWSGAAGRTRIWNRALIMAVEDVGPANPQCLLQIFHYMQLDNNQRLFKKAGQSRPTITNGAIPESGTLSGTVPGKMGENVIPETDDPRALMATCKVLLESPKSRVNDWAIHGLQLWAVASLPQHEHETLLRQALQNVAYNLAGLTEPTVPPPHQDMLQHIIIQGMIVASFRNGYRTVLQILSTYIQGSYAMGCYKMFQDKLFKKKDNMFWIHLVHLWACNSLPTTIQLPAPLTTEYDQYICQCYQHQGLVGIPDVAVDKHTLRGNRLGRNFNYFLREGSKLTNPHPTWEQLSVHYLSGVTI